MRMTKEQVIEFVNNAESNAFEVRAYKSKVCDLCGEPKNWDFYITSVKLRQFAGVPERIITNLCDHVTKHICTECFIKLFDREAKCDQK